MKKTLLSLVALSAMLSAGQTNLSGNLGGFYQTSDINSDFFAKEGTALTGALQLRGQKTTAQGLFAGGEITATYSPDTQDIPNRAVLANGNFGDKEAAAITQAFVGFENELGTIKIGRQTMDKNESPLVFSEEWNIVQNGVEGVTAESQIKDTTVSGFYVNRANNFRDLSGFKDINADNGLYGLTVTDNTIENFEVTGAYVFAGDYTAKGSAHEFLVNSQYDAGNVVGSVQAAYVGGDAFDDATLAFGVMADIYVSDKPYPIFYSPSSVFDYIGKKDIICMLTHPRQWRTHKVINTIDNIRRAYEGMKW